MPNDKYGKQISQQGHGKRSSSRNQRLNLFDDHEDLEDPSFDDDPDNFGGREEVKLPEPVQIVQAAEELQCFQISEPGIFGDSLRNFLIADNIEAIYAIDEDDRVLLQQLGVDKSLEKEEEVNSSFEKADKKSFFSYKQDRENKGQNLPQLQYQDVEMISQLEEQPVLQYEEKNEGEQILEVEKQRQKEDKQEFLFADKDIQRFEEYFQERSKVKKEENIRQRGKDRKQIKKQEKEERYVDKEIQMLDEQFEERSKAQKDRRKRKIDKVKAKKQRQIEEKPEKIDVDIEREEFDENIEEKPKIQEEKRQSERVESRKRKEEKKQERIESEREIQKKVKNKEQEDQEQQCSFERSVNSISNHSFEIKLEQLSEGFNLHQTEFSRSFSVQNDEDNEDEPKVHVFCQKNQNLKKPFTRSMVKWLMCAGMNKKSCKIKLKKTGFNNNEMVIKQIIKLVKDIKKYNPRYEEIKDMKKPNDLYSFNFKPVKQGEEGYELQIKVEKGTPGVEYLLKEDGNVYTIMELKSQVGRNRKEATLKTKKLG